MPTVPAGACRHRPTSLTTGAPPPPPAPPAGRPPRGGGPRRRDSARDPDAVEAERIAARLAAERPALERYVRALVAPDLYRAEDIVQETMMRAWQRGDQLDGYVRQWLFRIARNLAIDTWRKERVVVLGDLSRLGERADRGDLADHVSNRRVLVDGLRQLPPVHSEILVHVHLFGHGTDEVARTLGIPSGTVKSRTHNAVRSLRRALHEVA
jgi:RNA polymerase sigma-70 factor (ECF subfamily)